MKKAVVLFNLGGPDKLENVSDILKRLYESRLAQAEMKSMKEQIEDIYQKRS